MACFLDFRGFETERGFVFKEIALLCSEGRLAHVWTLRPPCPKRQLPPFDLRLVHVSNIGLAWEDGTISYGSLESIFVTVARKFKRWIVESEAKKELLFPYKAMSVQIEVRPLSSADTNEPALCCVYDHEECAMTTVTQMFNDSHSNFFPRKL